MNTFRNKIIVNSIQVFFNLKNDCGVYVSIMQMLFLYYSTFRDLQWIVVDGQCVPLSSFV